jgi:glucose-fructose oxidoreductase
MTKPDLVILCPATGRHAEWTEKVAPLGVHVLMEKPFAANLADADRMIATMTKAGKQLAINWPLRWYPSHVTAKRLLDEGTIGDLIEVHYYDGNRGPMRHLADKVEVSEEQANREKSKSWFYRKSEGGGSLQDYLGYGVTLGTWFQGGRAPIEVTAVVDQSPGLEVDEHSITIARYERGLSKFETRWGTFTDPWTLQPQPKCGFVLLGTAGTISSYDYERTVRVQTEDRPEGFDLPVDELKSPERNPVEYFLDCLERGAAVEGPLSPETCRIGQQIVDSAVKSADERRTVALVQ